eukprot:scaffold175000_cov21-Prasinocladus_malaysianus.AAC.1
MLEDGISCEAKREKLCAAGTDPAATQQCLWNRAIEKVLFLLLSTSNLAGRVDEPVFIRSDARGWTLM